jgi:sporulation protein YlmC with PRC-barrel domain
MEKTDKPLTRGALVSMQVIDANGGLVGKVKDIAFSLGKTSISLSVENEAGKAQDVSWEDVEAVSDFIVLKPVPERVPNEEEKAMVPNEQLQQKPVQTEVQKQSDKPVCPTCGKPLKWIPQYQRWYCNKDKKYV